MMASLCFFLSRTIVDRVNQVETPFAGEIEVDKMYYGGMPKKNEDAAQQIKCPSLVYSSAAVGCMPRSSPTRKVTL